MRIPIAVMLVCISFRALAWLPEQYPDYCSRNMSVREIPPLTAHDLEDIDQLLQVQVVIRHGSRTPYMKYSCWKDYNIHWDHCNVTEIMYTSPSPFEKSANWLFRKRYDGSPNFLGGNCKTGQLLENGYHQESANGKILRKAYIGPNKYNLFKSAMWELNNPQHMYFRSDDEQRTLMSGQSLIHSFFDIKGPEIIDWHTGDYQLDTLYPNSIVCPRLNNITTQAFRSVDYMSSPSQVNKQDLERAANSIFGTGYWDWTFMIDCLMTSVCNDYDIPNGDVSDNGYQMTEHLFVELAKYQENDAFYKLTHEDSIFSKLAMSNVAFMIRTQLEAAMKNDTHAKKFILYAGHDTTIMPLLAILLSEEFWDGKWAPYGALLSLELYRAKQKDNFLFRIVYNGKPLKLKVCSKALCDVGILLKILSFGEREVPLECKAFSSASNQSSMFPDNDDKSDVSVLLSPLIVTALVSFFIGAVCSYAFLSKTEWQSQKAIYSKIGDTSSVMFEM